MKKYSSVNRKIVMTLALLALMLAGCRAAGAGKETTAAIGTSTAESGAESSAEIAAKSDAETSSADDAALEGSSADAAGEETAGENAVSGEAVSEEDIADETTAEALEDLSQYVDDETEAVEKDDLAKQLSAAAAKAGKSNTYLCPKSSSKYLKWDDVKKLKTSEYRLARNEIFARHGYIFTASDLKKYFSGKSWYKGKVKASDFKESVFNTYERANIKYLKSLESAGSKDEMKTASTKTTIDKYGFESGHSALSFDLKAGSCEDEGQYYSVKATYYQAIKVSGQLKIGDKVKVSFDDIKGKTKTLVRKSDGLHDTADPDSLYYYTPSKKGKVTLYEFSDDRVEKPIKSSKLMIRKDATVEISILGKKKTFAPDTFDQMGTYFNAVYFDKKGYVVRLVFNGD